MIAKYVLVATLMLLLPLVQASYAEQEIPEWIKMNAGWWANGDISESDFVQGMEFLINKEILVVPTVETTDISSDTANSDEIPEWIKMNAGWWADGMITNDDFVNGIQYLMKQGIITISSDGDKTIQKESTDMTNTADKVLESLQAEFATCQEITKAYERIQCQNDVQLRMDVHYYKHNSDIYETGPITFYYPGIGSEGNDFFMEGDQPILTVRILAENTGSNDNVAMLCTGPAVCNYDVWDGSKAFKYSGMDFTNGQIVLKPGDARVFNMLFGPNIGYGGTQFQYDASKEYVFRISEPWGSVQIPLELK
jgi:hypothetical protein